MSFPNKLSLSDFDTVIVWQFCCFSRLLQSVLTWLREHWGLKSFFFPSKELLTIFSLRVTRVPFQVLRQVRPAPITTLCVWNFGKLTTLKLGNMFIKMNFRKQSEIQNYFGEQGTVQYHKWAPSTKGKGWLKWTTSYPRPQMIPSLAFLALWKFYQPHSPRLTPQLNEEIKYVDEMTKKKSTIH